MSYKIIGKYIKELNFSIPKPEIFFLLSKNISNYKINIDIKSTQIKQNMLNSMRKWRRHVGNTYEFMKISGNT